MPKILELVRVILRRISLLERELIFMRAVDTLGRDASPDDRADDVVGCAESVTSIVSQLVPMPIILGTYTLERHLMTSKDWVVTQTPQRGDIIISATGTSRLKNPPIRGHVGIVGDNGIIMANDSYTGKWSASYTIDTWNGRYKDKGGYPVTFYTYLKSL